ncbi:MAG: hypothetical protein ACK55Z_12820 [bacterium]
MRSFELFKKLSQQFMVLSQKGECLDGEITKEKYELIVLKYDNLIADCSFEEIPEKYKLLVATKYTDANKQIPIQLNGTIGNVVKRTNEV